MTQPIGLTVLGGMTFGSLMTLFVMPVIYFIFNKKGEAKRLAQLEEDLKNPIKTEKEVKAEERKSRGLKKIVKALENRVEKKNVSDENNSDSASDESDKNAGNSDNGGNE